MTENQIEAALENMRTYGGHFACGLANLYEVADSANQRALRTAFSSLFESYAPRPQREYRVEVRRRVTQTTLAFVTETDEDRARMKALDAVRDGRDTGWCNVEVDYMTAEMVEELEN